MPQLGGTLISGEKLALSGWKTVTFDSVKEMYKKQRNKMLETIIQNEAQQLYIVDPTYFHITESAHLSEVEGQVEGIVELGEQGEEDPYCDRVRRDTLHGRRVTKITNPVNEVQRLSWESWYTQFNDTLHDHDMTDYDAQLWVYMILMEWDCLAPLESNWFLNSLEVKGIRID